MASGWLPPSGRVLDIGCGLGEISSWFAGRGYSVLGVDIAPSATERARALHADMRSPPQFLALDLCASPPPGGPFDILVDRGCLHALPGNLVEDFARNVAAAAAPHARMLLFLRAYRGGEPFGDEAATRERVEWVAETLRGHFVIERYAPTSLAPPGDPDPENRLPGIAFWLTSTSPR